MQLCDRARLSTVAGTIGVDPIHVVSSAQTPRWLHGSFEKSSPRFSGFRLTSDRLRSVAMVRPDLPNKPGYRPGWRPISRAYLIVSTGFGGDGGGHNVQISYRNNDLFFARSPRDIAKSTVREYFSFGVLLIGRGDLRLAKAAQSKIVNGLEGGTPPVA